MSGSNPYEGLIVPPRGPAEPPSAQASAPVPPAAAWSAPAAVGAQRPQRAVPLPDVVDRLPVYRWQRDEPVWWLGVHGGAGETSLAAAAGIGRACGHMWPAPPSGSAPVLLVARTDLRGLSALRRAAQQWAAGDSGGGLVVGAVLVPDQPKPLPRQLRDLQRVVAGGIPRTWVLPWVPAWRVEGVTEQNVPNAVKKVLSSATAVDVITQREQ